MRNCDDNLTIPEFAQGGKEAVWLGRGRSSRRAFRSGSCRRTNREVRLIRMKLGGLDSTSLISGSGMVSARIMGFVGCGCGICIDGSYCVHCNKRACGSFRRHQELGLYMMC
jgi:hypothetical protein